MSCRHPPSLVPRPLEERLGPALRLRGQQGGSGPRWTLGDAPAQLNPRGHARPQQVSANPGEPRAPGAGVGEGRSLVLCRDPAASSRPGVLLGARGQLNVTPFPEQGLEPKAIRTREVRRRGVFPETGCVRPRHKGLSRPHRSLPARSLPSCRRGSSRSGSALATMLGVGGGSPEWPPEDARGHWDLTWLRWTPAVAPRTGHLGSFCERRQGPSLHLWKWSPYAPGSQDCVP